MSDCINCAVLVRRDPVLLDKKAVQEHGVKVGLSILDARKKLLESKPKTKKQSYASVCVSVRNCCCNPNCSYLIAGKFHHTEIIANSLGQQTYLTALSLL
jgi:hypothetical protein